MTGTADIVGRIANHPHILSTEAIANGFSCVFYGLCGDIVSVSMKIAIATKRKEVVDPDITQLYFSRLF